MSFERHVLESHLTCKKVISLEVRFTFENDDADDDMKTLFALGDILSFEFPCHGNESWKSSKAEARTRINEKRMYFCNLK
jgi:hypothetical protein